MTRAIKIGLWSGIFGLFVVFLFGGLSARVTGLICGVIVGMLGGARTEGDTMRDGVRDGVLAGVVGGVILLLSALIRHSLLDSLLGVRPPQFSAALLDGLTGVALMVVLGAALGAAHFVPGNRGRYATWGILGAVIVAYPFVDYATQFNQLGIVIASLIFVLLALGLNVVVGYAGLLDLGYAAFFAIGAYTTALLSSGHFNIHLSFWLVIWIAAASAGLFGFVLGAPTLPLRGDYLAIVTLGFGEIVPIVFRNLDKVNLSFFGQTIVTDFNLTGGELGISPIDAPQLVGVNFADRSDQRAWYFLLILLILLSVFMISRLRQSRLGRAWMAMREDELAAESMGINIVRTKLLAFAMGASFSGFGGAYFAAFVSGTFPSSFDFSVSVIVLCMVILGGLGNMAGVIVGGLIIELSDRLFLPQLSLFLQALTKSNPNLTILQSFDPTLYRAGLFGLVLVLMMQLRPEGLLPNARVRMQLHAYEQSEEIAEQERTDLYDIESEAN